MRIGDAITGALVLGLAAAPARGQLAVEYVAHASFAIEAPDGTRVVIDPYNSYRWLGYRYPQGIEADAVLVTHPHYDHDATYYFPAWVPVLRRPGRYAVGGLGILGVQARHADPYGEEFEQESTLWLVEAGGLRVAHLGDSGPLGPEQIAALGRVDVLMLPVDDLDHILKRDEVAAIRAALDPLVTIPMHYRIEALSDLPASLGPIRDWLAEQSDPVVRHHSHRVVLEPGAAGPPRILVLQPSPEVEPWPAELRAAWDQRQRLAAALDGTEREALPAAFETLRAAAAAVPEAIPVRLMLAEAILASGRRDDGVALLERALAGAGRDDWEFTLRARARLARLYSELGRDDEAALQYRLVLQSARRTALRREAEAFLATRR